LVENYANALKKNDYASWRDLLEPLHYGNRHLREDYFNLYQVSDVNIKSVDGHNVYVQMTFKSGGNSQGWLQFHPSGTLKYTPLVFKHPVAKALYSLYSLYSRDHSERDEAVRNLREANVPLFGFDTKASNNEKQESIEKIFEWFKENGSTHDVDDPKLNLPKDQFDDLIKNTKVRLLRAKG
jgi:hypothetical protein